MISPDMNGSRDADLKLIQRILTGERDLFHELVKPYERGVYVALLSMLKHATDAEDAAQEVMLKAYRSLRLFRGDAKFSTWLMTIALNEGRSRLGKAGRHKESSLDEEIDKHSGDFTPALLTDWRPVPNEMLEQAELASKIRCVIETLPDIYREVFTLRDVEEFDVDEVAGLLQVTSNTVRVRLHRARAMMQKQLAPVLKDYTVPRRRRWFGGAQ